VGQKVALGIADEDMVLVVGFPQNAVRLQPSEEPEALKSP